VPVPRDPATMTAATIQPVPRMAVTPALSQRLNVSYDSFRTPHDVKNT
jgi:hypothetical protein